MGRAPKYLVVGPENEYAGEQLLASFQPTSRDDVSTIPSTLTLIVESRLEGNDWWLFADPAQLPSMQMASLAGAQGVTVQRQEAWTHLGTEFRVFMDRGFGWLDWRGAHQNNGGS